MNSKKTYSVSVVIPNWNGVYLMEKHLQKTIDASPGAEIVVADDMSTDGSVEYLKKNFLNVIVVTSKKRQGFAGNVNAGVKRATGEIVVLLNTDVEPKNGYLSSLLSHFEDLNVFAVGCLEESHDKKGLVKRGRGIAHWQKGFYVHSRGEVDKHTTAWVSGGSGAFRKSMWNSLGGMDTLYNPFYWEDIDLSYRARKAGYKILFEPKSVVGHFHEEGKIKQEYSPRQVKKIVYRNQFIFIWKNVTDTSIICAHIVWTPIRLIQAVFRGDVLMLEGYIRALYKLPMVFGRRMNQRSSYMVSDKTLDLYEG